MISTSVSAIKPKLFDERQVDVPPGQGRIISESFLTCVSKMIISQGAMKHLST